jgi:hypothetical protein
MSKYTHISFNTFPELIEGLRFHMENHVDKNKEFIVADNLLNYEMIYSRCSIIGFFCTECASYFYINLSNLNPVDKKIIGSYENQCKLPNKIRSSEFFGF